MEKTSIKPLGENVLIEPQEPKKQTEQGIYLPQSSDGETPQQGQVVAIGESKDIKVKRGDMVIYRKYSGTEVKVDDKKLIILKNEDILAVIE